MTIPVFSPDNSFHYEPVQDVPNGRSVLDYPNRVDVRWHGGAIRVMAYFERPYRFAPTQDSGSAPIAGEEPVFGPLRQDPASEVVGRFERGDVDEILSAIEQAQRLVSTRATAEPEIRYTDDFAEEVA